MATSRHSTGISGLAVRLDRPLIGIIFIENGQEVTRYFADEAEADAAVAHHSSSICETVPA